MLPTINPTGDFILVEKWTHLSKRGYKVGDIVQGRHPYENHPVCKRIIGRVANAKFPLANAKGGDIVRPDVCSKELIKIPKGHVWIQGDNLSNSIDSRNYGAVPEATLKGRVLGRVVILFLQYPLTPSFLYAIDLTFRHFIILWLMLLRIKYEGLKGFNVWERVGPFIDRDTWWDSLGSSLAIELEIYLSK